MTNETYKIADVLADENHEAHNAARGIMEKLESGEISLCACIGPMYGEPYCACRMKQEGLEHIMESNPLRITENKRFEEDMRKWIVKMNKLEEE
jgi:predicted amino acid racemase